jgi:hypothetical protein
MQQETNCSNAGVICILPKAGLGNQMFPLLKAVVFAELNGLPLTVTGYLHIKIGPWLRGEKSKRRYSGFFRFQKKMLPALWQQFAINFKRKLHWITEPAVEKKVLKQGQCFLFSSMPHWENYFDGLKQHRALVKEMMPKLVSPVLMQQLEELKPPCIGVHIRMGDFRKLGDGENFAAAGAVRTPVQYFIKVIQGIRQIHGTALPVAVFTDGYRKELNELFLLENVQLAEGKNDLLDLLLLSKSSIIVTSAGSTFSYWSAFLSDAPVIMHPDHLHAPLRSEEVNMQWYEGPFDEEHELLLKNIRAIPF